MNILACLLASSRAPETFISYTLPEIFDNTIVVAAAHPTLRHAHAKSDGWFLSDFYAFNYLLKGVGHRGDQVRNIPGQVWLTASVSTDFIRFFKSCPSLLVTIANI